MALYRLKVMLYKKLFIIIGILLAVGLLVRYISLGNKKTTPEVKGEATVQESSPPIDEGEIPQGKFYAPILLYHHIALKRPQNSYFVSPEIFDEQMKWLKDNDYKVISLDQFYLAAIGKEKIPKKPVIITFDDGFRDQYKNAFPILKKYGFTATFYVKTNNLNKGGMTWDELEELKEAGNIIASHSVNHLDLTKMTDEELKSELEESKNILEKNLGIEIKHFCYPGGTYSKKIITALKEAGYLTSTTTKHEVYHEITNDNSPFVLSRVHIDDEMPTFIDWVQGINLY